MKTNNEACPGCDQNVCEVCESRDCEGIISGMDFTGSKDSSVTSIIGINEDGKQRIFTVKSRHGRHHETI